jgi:hypothetical protein
LADFILFLFEVLRHPIRFAIDLPKVILQLLEPVIKTVQILRVDAVPEAGRLQSLLFHLGFHVLDD